MKPTFKFTVEVELENMEHSAGPDCATYELARITVKQALRDHIKDSIEAWGGQLWPGHVMWSGNVKKVSVRYVINRRRRIK